MAITFTFDDSLGRVRIAATGLAAADGASVERSTDQIRWTTVRGGSAWPCSAGAFTAPLYDYEFAPNVANYYRVRGVESAPITFVGVGAGVSGNNTSLTPPLPASIVVGDLLVILASIRNTPSAGTVDVPAGWQTIRAFGNVALLGRRYQSGDAAPLVTFSGGVANADTLARMAAWRSAELTPVTGVDLFNASAQDIAYPALTVPDDNMLIIDAAWKQDDYSANTPRPSPGTFTSIGGVVSTAGDDAAMSWWYSIQTAKAALTAGTHTVTGGAAAISRSMVVALEHAAYLNEQIASFTPTITQIWLKSVGRPFLNMPVAVADFDPVTRPARGQAFEVVGRSTPVAVTDVRGSKRWTLLAKTYTADEEESLDLLLAGGDILLVQVPPDDELLSQAPSGFVSVGDVTVSRPSPVNPLRIHSLPLTQVAPPGPDVVGSTSTCAAIANAFATCADAAAEFATCADMAEFVASPSDVIVP